MVVGNKLLVVLGKQNMIFICVLITCRKWSEMSAWIQTTNDFILLGVENKLWLVKNISTCMSPKLLTAGEHDIDQNDGFVLWKQLKKMLTY